MSGAGAGRPTLQEQLDELQKQWEARVAPEVRAIAERAIDDLRASGILQRVVKVGDRAPDFELLDTAGRPVRLADLRARGPVVLSFFRGRW